MVRFPDERPRAVAHRARRWHRIDRLRHIVGWFDKWLQGKSMPEYGAP